MKNKISFVILLMLVISLILPFSSASANSSVFGKGESGSGSSSGTTLQNQAEAAGSLAGSHVAEFNDIEGLNIALDNFFTYIRWGIAFMTTLGTITSFLVLSMAFVRLASAPSHAIQRRNCYMDILKGGVSCILLGGLTLLMTIFYKTFSVFITKTVNISGNWKVAFSYALVEYKYLICGVCGVLSLTMFVIFIKDVLTLASSGGNANKRATGMQNILITGAATIGIGGVGILVAIFNGLLAF